MPESPFDRLRDDPATRRAGLGLMGAGLLLIVLLGVLDLASSDGAAPAASTDMPAAVSAPGTTDAPATTTTTGVAEEPAPTTTATPVATTTTTAAPVTTTTTAATTTTTTTTTTAPVTPRSPDDLVAEFVEGTLTRGLDDQDADLLFDHLHPVVIGTFGAEVCRQFVADTVMLIESYVVEGPVTVGVEEYAVDGETVVVDPTFTAPVEFVFLGETVRDDATFAPVTGPDGATIMTWFTACG